MLGVFFGNVSHRAFGRMGAGIDTLENKFKQLGNVAQSRMGTLRTGAERFGDAVQSINRGLREQANRIRGMPRMPKPPPQTFPTGRGMPSQPRHHSSNQPRGEDGRYLPGRRRGGGGGPRFGSRFSPGAGGFGGISAFGGLGSIGVLFGGVSAARGFGRFDANLATLQAEAGLDETQRKDVTGQILDIAGSTQFDTQQVSSTLIAMVKDGIELNQALEQVPNVLRLAVAESTDLESAWSAMRGFVQSTNSEWSDSVRLSDMMSNATSLSAAKLADLQDIASRGLTAHSSLDAFSTEGFLAITGILKSLNISNEVIGTGMRQFGTTIARATEGGLDPKAMAQLQARGIQFERGMTEIEALKELQQGVQGMADTELKNFFHDVFGERAKKVFENVIPKVDELAEKMELIRKKGTVNKKFAVHAKSLTNQFKLLTSAGDSLIKKFMMMLNEGEGFGSGIGWVTEKITQFTAFMESNEASIQAWWGNFREIMGGLFNLVATGIETVANFWSGLSEGEKTIVAIGAVIGAFVLGPVTGLIAAGALIIAKWDEIKDFFSKLWDKMDEPVLGFIKTVSDNTMSVVNWIRRQWDEMSPYFKKIWDGISFVTENAWKVIRFAAEGAWEFIKILWQPVSAFFEMLWQGVLLATEVAWFAVKNVVKGVVLAIEGLWNGLKAVFNWAPVKWIRGKFEALIGFFANLVGKLKAPFEDFIGFVTGIFEKIAKGIETVRGWFRRGEEGEHKLVLTVDTEQAQKEVKSAVGASGTLKQKIDANAPKMKRVPEDMRNLTPEQFFQKQKSDTFLQETLPATVAQTLSNLAASMLTKQALKPVAPTGATHYESYADTSGKASGVARPIANLTEFLKGQEEKKGKESRASENRRRAFGVNLKPRAMLGTRDVEKMYQIDERAMANVREHFEDVAEKEFLSGLKTYAEQSFSDIDATLTEAQRSMREKAFAAQKFLREDAERWKKTVESGVLDRLSASVEAAGVTAKHKETYGYLQKALAGDSFLSMPEKFQHLQADNIPSVLQPLQGRISPEKLSEVIDLFQNLSKNAPYMPDMQRALKIDSLSEDIEKGIEVAGLQRGHDLLRKVMSTGDTITQAKARLSETDAGLLQSAFEQLKPFAHLLPMMQKLLAREAMLTGDPEGTKMNVFEFPTLTAEQHEALTSTFNSGFLSLIDIQSAQLAVLQSIAAGLGAQKIADVLGTGSVIKQQKGTLYDDYLSHRHSQTYKQVSEKMNLSQPAGVAAKPSTVISESPVMDASYQKPIDRTVTPEVLVDVSPEVSVANLEISLEPLVTPELPIVSPQIEDVAAPHAPAIDPQIDTRFDNILDYLQPQPPTSQGEQVTATGDQIVKSSESEKTINNTFNITIEAGDRSAEELYEEIMAIAQERSREKNF